MEQTKDYQIRFSAYFKTLSEIVTQWGFLSYYDTTVLLQLIIDHLDNLKAQTVSLALDPDHIHIQTKFRSLCSLSEHPDIWKAISDNLKCNGFYSDSIPDSDTRSPFKSPEEMMESHTPDSRSDVYNAAAIIYFAVTGQKIPVSYKRLDTDNLKAPSRFNRELTPAHDQVLFQALDMNPEQRFQNLSDFYEAWNHPEQYSLKKKEEERKEKEPPPPVDPPKPSKSNWLIKLPAACLILVLIAIGGVYLGSRSSSGEYTPTESSQSMASGESTETDSVIDFPVDFVVDTGNILTNYIGTDDEVSVPEGIVKIGSSAFENCQTITKLVLPDTVTEIDDKAFSNCNNLREIVFSSRSQLTRIGKSSFARCTSLYEIELPDCLQIIDTSAFTGCVILENCNISATGNLQTIGRLAFSGCSKLSTVSLPASLKEVKSYAFQSCSALHDMYIYSEKCTMEEDAFIGCSENFILHGYDNSEVNRYALNEQITFQSMDLD